MSNLRRSVLFFISVCMLFTQNMSIAAMPMKMSTQVEHSATHNMSSMNCHQNMTSAQDSSPCCQHGDNQHQCSGECNECFSIFSTANLNLTTELVFLNAQLQIHHSNFDFFYHYKPDNGLRPPITA